MGQKIAAYNADTGQITAFYDSVDSPVPDNIQTMTLDITDEQYKMLQANPGYTIQNGALTPPSESMTLAQAQAAQLAAISAACQAAILKGFVSSALGTPHTYPMDMTSQSNLQAAVIRCGLSNPPPPATIDFMCADVNGVWARRPHTPQQIVAAALDGMNYVQAMLAKNDQYAAQINAATTVANVQAVIWQ